jgi:hypothetical protein
MRRSPGRPPIDNAGTTQDGERLVAFSFEGTQEDAVASILQTAAGAGLTLTNQTAASDSVVLEFTNGSTEYTAIATADPDVPGDIGIALYYPAGPLSLYP